MHHCAADSRKNQRYHQSFEQATEANAPMRKETISFRITCLSSLISADYFSSSFSPLLFSQTRRRGQSVTKLSRTQCKTHMSADTVTQCSGASWYSYTIYFTIVLRAKLSDQTTQSLARMFVFETSVFGFRHLMYETR